MPFKLYKMDASPPARAAMMACGLFNVPVEMVDVNLLEGQHLTPEYLKMNPLHSVPCLQDGDFVIHDSHAILMYLADAYGKDDSLYPKDAKKRALVNQKLLFDTAILFPRLRNVTYPAIIEGKREVVEKQLKDIEEAYGFAEEFLSRTKFLATDDLTIADVAAITTFSGLVYIVPIDAQKYPRTKAWMQQMEKQSIYKNYCATGAEALGALIKKSIDLG